VTRKDWVTLAVVGLVAVAVYGAILLYIIELRGTCPVC